MWVVLVVGVLQAISLLFSIFKLGSPQNSNPQFRNWFVDFLRINSAQCDIACDKQGADWSLHKTCFSAFYTECLEIECYDLSLTQCLSPSSVHNCVINVGTNDESYCAANTDEGPSCKLFSTSKTDCESNDCIYVEDASVTRPNPGNQSLCRTKERSGITI